MTADRGGSARAYAAATERLLKRISACTRSGHFIRHSNFELWLAPNDGSALFQQDAT